MTILRPCWMQCTLMQFNRPVYLIISATCSGLIFSVLHTKKESLTCVAVSTVSAMLQSFLHAAILHNLRLAALTGKNIGIKRRKSKCCNALSSACELFRYQVARVPCSNPCSALSDMQATISNLPTNLPIISWH